MDSKLTKWNIYQEVEKDELEAMSKNIADTVVEELLKYVVTDGTPVLAVSGVVTQDTGSNYNTKTAVFWGIDDTGKILVNASQKTVTHDTPLTIRRPWQ